MTGLRDGAAGAARAGTGLPDGVTLVRVPWDDAAAAALRADQQAELSALYGDEGDVEAELPREQMLATVLLHVDGQVAACGSLRATPYGGPGSGEVKRMYVRPALRGRGLSRVVLDALHRIAVEHGLRRLILETGELQREAVGLYRSAGYTPIPRYGPYVDEADSICFERLL